LINIYNIKIYIYINDIIVVYSDIMDDEFRYTHKISIDKTLLVTEVVEVEKPNVMDVKIVGKVNILETDNANFGIGIYGFSYYRGGKIQIDTEGLWHPTPATRSLSFSLIPNTELIKIFKGIITDNINKIETNLHLRLHIFLPKLEEYIKTDELRNNNDKLIIEKNVLQQRVADLEQSNQ